MTFQIKDLNHPAIQKYLKLLGLIRYIPSEKLDEAIVVLKEIIEQ